MAGELKEYSKLLINKGYLEDVAVSSVTTVFEEFINVMAVSAAMRSGTVKSKGSAFALSEIIRIIFMWAYAVLFQYLKRKDMAIMTSSVVFILFIYDLFEYFTNKHPLESTASLALRLTSSIGAYRSMAPTQMPIVKTVESQQAKSPLAGGIVYKNPVIAL